MDGNSLKEKDPSQINKDNNVPPPMIPLVPPPPRDGTPVSHLDALFTFVSYTFDLYLSLTYHSLDLRICFDLDNSHVQSHSRDLLQLDRTTICRVIKT